MSVLCVTLVGDVLFGNKSWAGPLFTISKYMIYYEAFITTNVVSPSGGKNINCKQQRPPSSTTLIAFTIVNGNGHKFDGGGPFYWVCRVLLCSGHSIKLTGLSRMDKVLMEV